MRTAGQVEADDECRRRPAALACRNAAAAGRGDAVESGDITTVPSVFGGVVDGGADAHVGGAAADVAGHRRVDVGVGRLRHSPSSSAIADMIWPDWQ